MKPAVRRWIDHHGVPRPGERVLCAVSGGADSVALLHVLRSLAPEVGFALHCGHFNHRLRGKESERDAAFVERVASELGLPFHGGVAGRLEPSGDSPETRARTARRRFLQRTAQEIGARRIALGHTLDDQAETVLMRAVVGTALTGLAAMRPVTGGGLWIRPLLGIRRRECRAYLRSMGGRWVEDSSNRIPGIPRNRIRTEILPLISHRLSRRAIEALAALADEARDVDDWLSRLGVQALESAIAAGNALSATGFQLVAERLRTYHAVVRRYALRAAYERMRGTRADLSRHHLSSLDRLLFEGGELCLPGGVRARGEQGVLRLIASGAGGEAAEGATEPSGIVPVGTAGHVDLPGLGVCLSVGVVDRDEIGGMPADDHREALFDFEQLSLPLAARRWRAGDRFVPFGSTGRQKLSDLFVDRKVPRSERHRVPILVDGEGILWVVGIRRSNRAPVTTMTRRLLRVAWEPRLEPGDERPSGGVTRGL